MVGIILYVLLASAVAGGSLLAYRIYGAQRREAPVPRGESRVERRLRELEDED